MATKICIHCNKEFFSNRVQKFCSSTCSYNFRKEHSKISVYDGIAPATIGAISELRVATDLLIKGFEVYRAVSPSCSGDLIAEKNNKIFKIDVKTAQIKKSGLLFYSTTNIRSEYLALVLKDEIVYKPELI
jgi:hypothetical protein